MVHTLRARAPRSVQRAVRRSLRRDPHLWAPPACRDNKAPCWHAACAAALVQPSAAPLLRPAIAHQLCYQVKGVNFYVHVRRPAHAALLARTHARVQAWTGRSRAARPRDGQAGPAARLVVAHRSRSACRLGLWTPAARSTISTHASPQSLARRACLRHDTGRAGRSA